MRTERAFVFLRGNDCSQPKASLRRDDGAQLLYLQGGRLNEILLR
jgi:hypothetical protein